MVVASRNFTSVPSNTFEVRGSGLASEPFELWSFGPRAVRRGVGGGSTPLLCSKCRESLTSCSFGITFTGKL